MSGMRQWWRELRDFDWNSLGEPREAGAWPLSVRACLAALLFAGTLGLGQRLLVAPLQAERARLQQQTATLSNDLAATAAALDTLSDAESGLRRRQAQWEALLATLPRAAAVPLRLAEISGLGLGRNLALEQMQTQAALPGPAHVALPLTLVVRGGYHALAGFM